MRTKLILLIILFLSSVFEGNSQELVGFPLPKIKLAHLPELLEGHWEYDFSFNSDSAFEMGGEYMQEYYVPYRIEFNKTTKRENKKILRDYSWLSEYRKLSCLSEYEFWVDYKGAMRYPKLISNKTDSEGNLLECKIELARPPYPEDRDYLTIQSISKGIIVLSNYQGDKRNDRHVFVREQLVKKEL